MRTRKFTSSELRQYQDCRRSWYIKYHLGYGPKRDAGEVGVSRVGTLYHLGVEAYYKGAEADDAIEVVAHEVARTVGILEEAGRDTKRVKANGDLVRIMLEGFFEWLAETGADADLEVVSVEEAQEVPFAADYFSTNYDVQVSLLGKFDLLARRRSNGKLVILDSKSVQSASDQELTAPIAPQFKHYGLIKLLQGERVDGALVRWARRVKRTARATPPFYGEVPVDHPLEVLRSYYLHTLSLVEEILIVERELLAGTDPITLGIGPRVTRDCGRCFARPVCPVMDDATMNATDLLAWSYERVNPLERYSEEASAEEEEE